MELDLEYFRRIIEVEIGKLPRKKLKLTKDKIESNLNILGISNTLLRALKIEEIYLLSQENQFRIYIYVFNNSAISEVLSWILMTLDTLELPLLIKNKEDLFKLSYRVENWWHCDLLTKIYANMLEQKRIILEELIKFSKSDNSWQRRLSLTSLIYYASQRKSPLHFDLVAHQVKILLDDPNYYVQKGLGWTLRELYVLYPEQTEEFLEIYIKDISSIAFQAATEKLSLRKKETFKELRKSSVSNPEEFEKKPPYERL